MGSGPSEADARRFVNANTAAPLPAAWAGWLERGAREDWSDRVGRLAVHATIVAGAEDGDLGEANQRRLNLPHYPGARVVVPRAAHLLPYEQPAVVTRLIEDAVRQSCA